MTALEGKFAHVRSENLDDYFKALGVPYIPRKMMCASNPVIQISKSDDKWTLSTSTLLRTVTYSFILGEEYEETMPGTVMKCIATLEEDKLVVVCVAPDGSEMTRTYSLSNDELIIVYRHKASQKEAIRHFQRTV